MKFGTVPKEVPAQRSLDLCAPKFAAAVEAMIAELGLDYMAFETLRTAERQAYLYGFGRDYDDGRGEVTKAATALWSWHGFGLGCDVVEKDATPWSVPVGFWNTLGDCAERHGLTWGGRWRRPDLPHVQWGKCPDTPTDADRTAMKLGTMADLWQKYGAS